MAQGTLLPNHAEVKLLCLRPKDGAIQMEVQGCRARVTCPVCGTPSGRVHSRYVRRLGDLPWEGLPVRILLSTRRFFCVGEGCRRHIFTEPFPGTVRRYARRTFLVPADTGFVTLQEIQERTFSLADYTSWSSVEQPEPSFISDLKTRKYTSVIDLEIVSRLEHLPEAIPDHCSIRTARSLTMEDLKDGNLILLGSNFSIPWIEALQKDLNFRFFYKPAEGRSWIENRSPAHGEAATYTSIWNGPSEMAYAVLAFIPNLNKLVIFCWFRVWMGQALRQRIVCSFAKVVG